MNTTSKVLDQKARQQASEYLSSEGKLLETLIEMRRKKAFAELGFTGIFDYCEKALRFSRAQAYYFKSVAEKSEEVPQIKEAVTQGRITLSQARRIVPVITKDNQDTWIEKAQTLEQRELEREVQAVNPQAHVKEKIRPLAKEYSELKVEVDMATKDNLVALQDILSQKLGKAATLKDVIAWATEVTREKFDPTRKAKRSLSRHAVSSGNEPPKPGRHPIPAAAKHTVAIRDDQRCTYVAPDGRRCAQKRWLQHHHEPEVINGGLNIPEHLKLLCHAHHRLRHR